MAHVVIRDEYRDLDWVVQVRNPKLGPWEGIAAFNSRQIAEHYARDCAKDNRYYRYRVIELSALAPTHHTVLETA